MTAASFVPAPGTPYWWDPEAPRPDLAAAPPGRADILVIGAGYTGLCAALHAHDAGARVAVIDAGWPGAAASTRNGGMFGAHPRLGWEELQARFGTETADGVFAEAGTSLEFVRALIARERIDAGHQATGRISLAWTRAHFERLKRVADRIGERSGVRVSVVEGADLGAEIATRRYFGGLLLPDHGGIDPRRFHDGLLGSVLERGIPVAPHCPARTWQRAAGGFVVETPLGQIRAAKIVLATNGYTTQNFPWARRRIFALPSFLIATEPLEPGLIARLAPGRRMMVETRARHSYFRISPDGSRILWGGRASMRRLRLDRAAARLKATMEQVWPETSGLGLTHAWCGNTGYSFNHMPWVGEHEGVHYAMGYSGSGTVMAPYLGAKAGLRAAEAGDGETAYADTRLRPSWLNPTGHPLFLYAADAWYRMVVDKVESRKGRR